MKFKAFMKLVVILILGTLMVASIASKFCLNMLVKAFSWLSNTLDKAVSKMEPAQQIRTILGTKD